MIEFENEGGEYVKDREKFWISLVGFKSLRKSFPCRLIGCFTKFKGEIDMIHFPIDVCHVTIGAFAPNAKVRPSKFWKINRPKQRPNPWLINNILKFYVNI